MPGDPLFGLGNLSTWQAAALGEGYSASEALSLFHDVGGGFVNFGTWYRNWGEVEHYLNVAGSAYPGELDQIPTETVGMAMGQGGEYAMNVRVQLQDQSTGEVMTAYYFYKSPDPFTPAEAINAAIDVYSPEGDEAGPGSDMILVGAVPGPAILTTPYVP